MFSNKTRNNWRSSIIKFSQRLTFSYAKIKKSYSSSTKNQFLRQVFLERLLPVNRASLAILSHIFFNLAFNFPNENVKTFILEMHFSRKNIKKLRSQNPRKFLELMYVGFERGQNSYFGPVRNYAVYFRECSAIARFCCCIYICVIANVKSEYSL